jgi:hypothetical protein
VALSLYRDAFVDFGGPLYTLEWIPAAALGRRRRDIYGVGACTCLSPPIRV